MTFLLTGGQVSAEVNSASVMLEGVLLLLFASWASVLGIYCVLECSRRSDRVYVPPVN